MQQQRRADRRHLGGRHLHAVIGDARLERGAQHRDAVDLAAAPAEADGADIAGRFRMLLQERHGGGDARRRLLGLDHGGEQVARLVLVVRRSAVRCQDIDAERQKSLERDAPRHVLDMRREPAVLVDDDDGRALALLLEARQVAVDLDAARVIGRRLDREARIVGRHDRGLRVIALQQRHQRRGGRGRSDYLGQTIEKNAAAHAAMGEVVVEVDDLLIHDVLPGRVVIR